MFRKKIVEYKCIMIHKQGYKQNNTIKNHENVNIVLL